MPLGTPEEYEAARQAEMADIELRNPGRGEYNLHLAVAEICREAAEFEEFRTGNVELEAELARRAVLLETRRRAINPIVNAARKVGEKIMQGFEAVGEPYATAYGGSSDLPPMPPAFPL